MEGRWASLSLKSTNQTLFSFETPSNDINHSVPYWLIEDIRKGERLYFVEKSFLYLLQRVTEEINLTLNFLAERNSVSFIWEKSQGAKQDELKEAYIKTHNN